MDKKVFFYILLFVFLFSQSVFAGFIAENTNKPNDLIYANQAQGYGVYVPVGVKLSVILSQELNSKTAVVGQNVNAILINDFRYRNQLIASSGSIVSGNIVFNKKASMAGKDAQMQVKFTTITTPYNNVIPISAVIETSDLSGILKGKNSNVSTIKDATVLNGGLGVAKALGTKGNEILILPNTKINIIFNQPITLGAT